MIDVASDKKSPDLRIDPELRDLIRPLSPDEFAALEALILADGTVNEVRELLKVKPHTILGWINVGELEAVNIGQGKKQPRYRISQEALDKFLASRTKAKPPVKSRRRKPYNGRTFIK